MSEKPKDEKSSRGIPIIEIVIIVLVVLVLIVVVLALLAPAVGNIFSDIGGGL
jgi:hypothetical protein